MNILLHKFYQGKLLSTQLATIEQGSKIVRIPINTKHTDQYTIRMSFTKFNSFYDDQFSFKLYERNKFLTIKTETFLSKLTPGQQETWRFKILDLEKNPSNAEVLASMYDESLDQFKKHFWDPSNGHYGGSRYDIPNMNSDYFITTRSHQFYNITDQIFMPIFKNYLHFDWFGLDFNDVTNANYKYIGRLSKKKKQKWMDKSPLGVTLWTKKVSKSTFGGQGRLGRSLFGPGGLHKCSRSMCLTRFGSKKVPKWSPKGVIFDTFSEQEST